MTSANYVLFPDPDDLQEDDNNPNAPYYEDPAEEEDLVSTLAKSKALLASWIDKENAILDPRRCVSYDLKTLFVDLNKKIESLNAPALIPRSLHRPEGMK